MHVPCLVHWCVYVCVHMYQCLRTYESVRVFMYVCRYTSVSTRVCVFAYIHIHGRTLTQTYTQDERPRAWGTKDGVCQHDTRAWGTKDTAYINMTQDARLIRR